MNHHSIRVPLEEQIAGEVYEALEGALVEAIIREARIDRIENEWKYILEGSSFRVTRELSPHIHDLFTGVLETLGFTEKTELYISNSATSNAFAIARAEEDQPHIINLNSSLVDRLSDDELRFVIGHEVGHLIHNSASIWRLIQFVYPDSGAIPLIMQNKINLWRKLAELTADRFGYLACPDLNTVLSCFFKMASGLDSKRIDFDAGAFLEEMDNKVRIFLSSSGLHEQSHPVNPIRVKAVELFSRSEMIKQVQAGQPVTPDDAFSEAFGQLVQCLMVIAPSELDMHRKIFLAAGGLIMANADEEYTKDEFTNILGILASYTVFPRELLEELSGKENLGELFVQSARYIMDVNPGERYSMLEFLVRISFADKDIVGQELGFVFQVGTELLGFHTEILFAGYL